MSQETLAYPFRRYAIWLSLILFLCSAYVVSCAIWPWLAIPRGAGWVLAAFMLGLCPVLLVLAAMRGVSRPAGRSR